MNTKCPNCGVAIECELKFCPHCGAALPDAPNPGVAPRFGFWSAVLQWILALGAVIFGGVGACSAYNLATGQGKTGDLGDMSGIFWFVGIIALGCCALCVTLGVYWKKKRNRK